MNYLTRRKDRYYLQVKQPEGYSMKVSLRTNDSVIARLLVAKAYEAITAFKIGVITSMSLKNEVNRIVQEYEQEMKAIHYRVLKERPVDIARQLDAGDNSRVLKILLKMMDTPYMTDDLSALDLEYARDVVTDWLDEKGYEQNEQVVDELAIVSNRLNRVRADANQLLIQNRLAEYERVVESLKGDESDAMKWHELYKLFLESKVKLGLSVKMQAEYNRYQEYLEYVQPDYFNSPIDRITRKQVREVVMGYRTLPKRNQNPYKDMSWEQLLDYIEDNEIDVEDCQSPSTADNLRKMVQGVFAHAVNEEVITASPANSLKLNLDLTSTRGYYRTYEALDIERVLIDWLNVEQKWVGLIGLYHGARAGEIAQLRKVDVKLDRASNRWYMVITNLAGSVKTKDSNRLVPVHKRLIELGFLNYVEDIKSPLLFPKINNSKMTQWLYRVLERAGVDRFDDLGLKRDFHSFRHTVITTLRRSATVNESIVQAIVGHKQSRLGVTDRYTHGFEIVDKAVVIDMLDYEV